VNRIEIIPLAGVPEVHEGDDLATLLLDACDRTEVTLMDGDVACVAQKIVSKAEGAITSIHEGEDPAEARRRIAREQATRVVADTPQVLIVETVHGFVCANAGIDASNVPDGRLSLLPDDPDASARRIAEAVSDRTGARIGVVVTDTFGRPWRMGQTDVAIGVAGFAALRDERGDRDREGRVLDVTVAAIADEIAAAADLAHRKGDGTPLVIVRGVPIEPDPDGTAGDLVRPAEEDLFRRAVTDDGA
jgi:coenzyme F420-0:L-glutamate ligase / coenzyme F420-1:gamma-L-glutamate ligase